MDATVTVWSCPLDLDEDQWQALTECLSQRERAEGAQRPDERDRRRFLAARGWRRRVLADQLGCEPADVAIEVDARGKPHVEGGELRFNASRSGDLCLVACSWEMEVGVDVEAVDPTTDVERFARRFFTPDEQRALADLPAAERRRGLYACWARKEAYLKGTGEGLDVPTASIEVWAGDDRPVTICGWRVHSLGVEQGYAAAVAGKSTGAWTPSGPRQQVRTVSDSSGNDG